MSMNIETDKKRISTIMAKQMMRYLKRDTLEDLQQTGNLRSHFEFGFGSDYIPKLVCQTEYNLD